KFGICAYGRTDVSVTSILVAPYWLAGIVNYVEYMSEFTHVVVVQILRYGPFDCCYVFRIGQPQHCVWTDGWATVPMGV
ncbi:MAG: hypothetical protein QF530_13615, partial [SAR202 cluster bacterium]|nr:hypothetical protein [SAR202 cluster bacterium]